MTCCIIFQCVNCVIFVHEFKKFVLVKDETPEVKKVEQPSKPSSKSDASNLFSSNGSDDEDNLFFIPKAGKTVPEESNKKISEPIGNVKG